MNSEEYDRKLTEILSDYKANNVSLEMTKTKVVALISDVVLCAMREA